MSGRAFTCLTLAEGLLQPIRPNVLGLGIAPSAPLLLAHLTLSLSPSLSHQEVLTALNPHKPTMPGAVGAGGHAGVSPKAHCLLLPEAATCQPGPVRPPPSQPSLADTTIIMLQHFPFYLLQKAPFFESCDLDIRKEKIGKTLTLKRGYCCKMCERNMTVSYL